MKDKILAAVDVGTNTFRLLIAGVDKDPFQSNSSKREIYSKRIITRLGEGIHKDRSLRKEAMDRGIAALRQFSEIISRHNVDGISAIATSALREASNRDEFLERAKEETGLEIKVISGIEEAKLTAAGMLTEMTMPKTALMVDIGGGSTELIFINSPAVPQERGTGGMPEPSLVQSLNLGVVHLAGKYMKNDPPLEKDLTRIKGEILHQIDSIAMPFKKSITGETVFIGTAGTISALAAMSQKLLEFDQSKIHQTKLRANKVRDIFSAISRVSSQERARLIPFEPARLDIIVPGTLILSHLMEIFGFEEITVSAYGLREGILIELYNRISSR